MLVVCVDSVCAEVQQGSDEDKCKQCMTTGGCAHCRGRIIRSVVQTIASRLSGSWGVLGGGVKVKEKQRRGRDWGYCGMWLCVGKWTAACTVENTQTVLEGNKWGVMDNPF